MANSTYPEFIFRTEDMKRLVDAGTEFIVVRSYLEAVTLSDGRKAGAVKVYADAVKKGFTTTDATDTIEGCPKPPCDTGG